MKFEEARSIAYALKQKMSKGSNGYGLFLIDGKVHSTRDNSTIFCRWEATGKPELIGRYKRSCPVQNIIYDLMAV